MLKMSRARVANAGWACRGLPDGLCGNSHLRKTSNSTQTRHAQTPGARLYTLICEEDHYTGSMEFKARNRCLAIAAAGAVVLVSACGGDDGHEPLSTEEIQEVLLPLGELPGTPTEFDEYFGDTPGDYPEEENRTSLTETFGDHECIRALEEVAPVDGDNAPEASGERWATLDPESIENIDDEASPSFSVTITSYAEEASTDEYWGDLQETCDGEGFTAEDDEGSGQQVSLEAADIGEFRGLSDQWEYETSGGLQSVNGYTLSATYGNQVIRVSAYDLPDEMVEEVLTTQLERLQAGPEDSEGAEAVTPEERDLPQRQLSSEELHELLLTEEKFRIPAATVDTDFGSDIFDDEYYDWGSAMLFGSLPVSLIDQTDAGETCKLHWDNAAEELLQGEASDDMAMAFARGPKPMSDDDDEIPQAAAILLQSYPHSTEEFSHAAQWDSFLSSCAGEWQVDGVQQSLESINIDGVDGYTAHTESTEDVEGDQPPSRVVHVAHVDFGQTSMRIISLDLSEEEMEEVVEAQLEKLESAD